MSSGPKHRKRSWCLLAAIVAAVAGLVGLGVYTMSITEATRIGSQGPLVESTPGSDPTPLLVRPRQAP